MTKKKKDEAPAEAELTVEEKAELKEIIGSAVSDEIAEALSGMGKNLIADLTPQEQEAVILPLLVLKVERLRKAMDWLEKRGQAQAMDPNVVLIRLALFAAEQSIRSIKASVAGHNQQPKDEWAPRS